MKTEQQNEIWALLPKEFKEEVKNLYRYCSCMKDRYELGAMDTLEITFGKHNLASDAEEEEMLYVSRKEAQGLFRACNEHKHECLIYGDSADYFDGEINVLTILFGSKCLPDNVDSLSQNPAENCDKANHISTDDNKPAEPKFKLGDKVKHIAHPHDSGIYRIDDIKKSSDGFIYHIQGLIGISNVKEFDLELYTEPEEKTSPNVNRSDINIDELVTKGYVVDPAKQFDPILKDSFRNERRLNIAATITAGVMANPNIIKSRSDLRAFSDEWLASRSLGLADALIAECEKGE